MPESRPLELTREPVEPNDAIACTSKEVEAGAREAAAVPPPSIVILLELLPLADMLGPRSTPWS